MMRVALKRHLCIASLCAVVAAAVPVVAADYTTGTPGGAGKVTVDPETGDRVVRVTPAPQAVPEQDMQPIYVMPQVGGDPYQHHSPSPRKSGASRSGAKAHSSAKTRSR